VRVAALEVLQGIFRTGSGEALSPPTIEAVTEALDDSSPDVRAASARGLGVAGPAARSAAARLREVSADDPVDYVRSAAADALVQIARTP
jgi:HEAT repeat protein